MPTSCLRARNSRGNASSTSTSAVARESGGPSALIIRIRMGKQKTSNAQRPTSNPELRNRCEPSPSIRRWALGLGHWALGAFSYLPSTRLSPIPELPHDPFGADHQDSHGKAENVERPTPNV